MRPTRTRTTGAARGVGAAVLLGALPIASSLLLSPTPAQAAAPTTTACAPGYTTEQGTCATPVAAKAPTAAQQRQQAAKDQHRAQIRAALLGRASTGGAASPATLDATAATAVRNFSLPEVAGMTIYKEGQGDGKKSYTCGPAATRNMVAAMYKRRDGAYKNISENQYAVWEGTTTAGTARANIAATLNNHFSAFGHWKTWRPTDRFDLLATIADDTYTYHQSVILNVDTEYYSFFNNKALNHFDFAYGYDNTNSAKRLVYVGEEWDPIFIYGSSSYGNPYGKHKEQLANVYQAISHTSIHGIVA